METQFQEYPDLDLLVIRIVDDFKVTEWVKIVQETIDPFMVRNKNKEHQYLIIDVTQIAEMKFSDFLDYLKDLAKRRAEYPEGFNNSLRQYLVGNAKWISNIRNIFQKQLNEQLGVFQTLDDAIQYVRNQHE